MNSLWRKFSIVIYLVLYLYIGNTSAAIIPVQSPGQLNDIQPNLQAAVNSASNGDIIQLPAGQFVLHKSVIITKFISIRGKGKTQTILFRSANAPDSYLSNYPSWESMFKYNINSTINSGVVVSDMTLKSKLPSKVNGDGLSLAKDIGIKMIRCKNFVITRCRFENFGNAAISVVHDDSIVGGLIFKNEFYHNVKGADGLGLGYGVVVYGSNTRWITKPRFGTPNFIFIENNTFDYHRHSVAAGGCALYVFRHNNVLNNVAGNTSHAIDAHEARLTAGENYYSTRAIEVYSNSIVNTTFRDGTSSVANNTPIVPGKDLNWLTECAIRTRGGEALIHDNYIEGYRFGVGLYANSIFTSAYPIPYQQGYLSALQYGNNHSGVGSGKEAGDVFIWNNNFDIYDPGNPANTWFYNYSTSHLVNSRDYHFSTPSGYQAYTYPHPLSGSPLTLTVTKTDVTCFGYNNGSIQVAVSGGSPGAALYTYSWSTNPAQTTSGISNLAPGTYTLNVNNIAGDVATAIVTINTPSAIALNTSITDELCHNKNGMANVTANGGVIPYSFNWNTNPVQTNDTAFALSTGVYSVLVTDNNGCTKLTSVSVGHKEAPDLTTLASPVSCYGFQNGAGTAVSTGGTPPYTYQWGTIPVQTTEVATGLVAGVYSVSVSDANNCKDTALLLITQPNPVILTVSTIDASCANCVDGVATLTTIGDDAPFMYTWSYPGIGISDTAAVLPPGTYTVIATGNEGCSDTITFVINDTSSISINNHDKVEDNAIKVLPNPAQGKFFVNIVSHTNENVTLLLYNAVGEQVFSSVMQFITGGGALFVDVQKRLPPGLYQLRINSKTRTWHAKVILTN